MKVAKEVARKQHHAPVLKTLKNASGSELKQNHSHKKKEIENKINK